MKHCILVKWNETVTDKAAIAEQAERVFAPVTGIPGVHGITLRKNIIDRPNRYDLLIEIDMEPEALNVYDDSAAHHAWKDGFGARIEKKAIFDFEE